MSSFHALYEISSPSIPDLRNLISSFHSLSFSFLLFRFLRNQWLTFFVFLLVSFQLLNFTNFLYYLHTAFQILEILLVFLFFFSCICDQSLAFCYFLFNFHFCVHSLLFSFNSIICKCFTAFALVFNALYNHRCAPFTLSKFGQ